MTEPQTMTIQHQRTAQLGDLAKLIRSKNAGPWMLTIDVMLPDAETFQAVIRSGALTKENVSPLLGVDPGKVEVYEYAPAHTVKISFPRHVPNGHPEDTDVFGGQQFAPLISLSIPFDS